MKKSLDTLTPAAITEQQLSEEDAELLKEIYERLEMFEQECRPYHQEAKTVREILRLRDPYQDPPTAKKKTLQLQTLKSTFNNCVADQMENMPEARLLPETPDLEEAAMDLQDAIHYVVYNVNNYEKIHRRRAEDLYGPGTAITQVVWDQDLNYGKGDVAIIRWPVEAFLWDSQVEDIQDSRALIKVAWHPRSWYKERYPEEYPFINSEDGQYSNVGMPSAQEGKNSSDEDRSMMVEYWWRTYDNKSRRYKINVAYAAGGALLECHRDVYMHGMYPFVFDVHSTIEGSPVGDGMVSELVGMMRYINRYHSYIDTNLRMSSKGRMLTRRNSGINKEELADWSVDLVEGDSVVQGEDWAWMQHQPFNSTIQTQMQYLENELKQDSGMNQYSRGESTGGIVSGKAIVALQEAGGKISGLRTDTLNNGFRQIVELILWVMAEFYEKDRVILITGRDVNYGEGRVKTLHTSQLFGKRMKGSIQPPPYLVQVEVNRKNPARVDATNEMYMQAYTMAAQAQQFFPLSALFRLMNIDGKDRLLPVIEENEHYQEQMQQLQAQLEQMGQQMEQLQQENENLQMASQDMASTMESMAAGGNGGGMQTPGMTDTDVEGTMPDVGGEDPMAAMMAEAEGQGLTGPYEE